MPTDRRTVLDAGLTVLALSAVDWGCYQYDLIKGLRGELSLDARFSLIESLIFAVFVMAGFAIFAWREHRRANEEIGAAERLAETDALTGIANRRGFDRNLAALARQAPQDGHRHVLALIDLNGFKTLNDTYGHGVGDEALSAIARRISDFAAVLDHALAARIGGDEFALLIANHAEDRGLAEFMADLRLHLAQPIVAAGREMTVEAAIGCIAFPDREAAQPSEILRRADFAMYGDKPARSARCAAIAAPTTPPASAQGLKS